MFPNLRVWIKADACSISPLSPTTAALPYAFTLSTDPISLSNSSTNKLPSSGANLRISGLKFSTKPLPNQGLVITAATEISSTGIVALLFPSI